MASKMRMVNELTEEAQEYILSILSDSCTASTRQGEYIGRHGSQLVNLISVRA